tara:strand:- start:826 stop:1164 length:339 start_codon:yes stop_codon:yes gene_type:complete
MNPDYFKYHSATYYDTTYKEPDFASPELFFRETILEKLDSLKERIEDWAAINGYDKLDNSDERKSNETGELIWRRTDWEYVDDTYGLMINDESFYPGKECFKKMNVMWKKYR